MVDNTVAEVDVCNGRRAEWKRTYSSLLH
jgi:hypothetical protein